MAQFENYTPQRLKRLREKPSRGEKCDLSA